MSSGSEASRRVETLRKPSTGLKQDVTVRLFVVSSCRDTQKTQHGIETKPEVAAHRGG